MSGKTINFDDKKIRITSFHINNADSVITNFHNKKTPKEKAPCKCLLITMIDCVIKANEKYYSQKLLEECKYVQEKIKTENYIDEDLEKSDSNDETESDIDNDENDE